MTTSKIQKITIFFIFLGLFCNIISVSHAKTAKKSIKTSQIQNGDPSNNIHFSEIFPNPKGTDTKKEWIELINEDGHDINLGNWSLSFTNTSKTTKAKIIKFNDKTIIKTGSYLIIDSSTTNFSILNSNCKIELKDYVGKIIDTIEYKESEENLSLSRINITPTNKTISTWTTPTKNQPNPIYYKISGSVQKKNLNEENNYLTIKSDNTSTKIFIPKEANLKLIDSVLNENSNGDFLTTKNQNKEHQLIDFKINSNNQKTQQNGSPTNWIYYPLILGISGFCWLLKRTFI